MSYNDHIFKLKKTLHLTSLFTDCFGNDVICELYSVYYIAKNYVISYL